MNIYNVIFALEKNRYMFYRSYLLIILFFLSSFLLYGQKLEKLPRIVNSKYDEISPVLTQDGKRLYFTRVGYPAHNTTIIEDGKHVTLPIDGENEHLTLKKLYSDLAGELIDNPKVSVFNQDIWIAELNDEGEIIKVVHPGYPMNNAFPNSVLSIIHETGELVVLNRYIDGKVHPGISLYKRQRNKPLQLPESISVANYGSDDAIINLSVNGDGRVIVWSLKRSDSYGDRDLYVSFRISENIYSAPRNLGPVINTPYRESSPYLSPDGKILYFSSNRPLGMGGMDIYYSKRLDNSWKNWSPVVHLDPPINSAYNDSKPMPSMDGKYFYFTSNRDGSSDIFRYVYPKEEKEEVVDKIEEVPTIKEVLIEGLVIDSLSRKPLAAEVSWGKKEQDRKDFPYYYSTLTGEFVGELAVGESYTFFAQARGYEAREIHVTLPHREVYPENRYKFLILMTKKEDKEQKDVAVNLEHMKESATIEKQILPDELADSFKVQKTVLLNNIYFKRSEAIILISSLPALKELYNIMVDDPQKIILISGHTDNRGPKDLLMQLSLERANMIKAYLLKRGISSHRIKTIGYGAQRPLNENSTEEEREQNRRVEISFLTRN